MPIYTTDNIRIVHNLHYDWTGWTETKKIEFPPSTHSAIESCRQLWNEEGLRLESYQVKKDQIQCLFEVNPRVSPIFCSARSKGRLQYALRKCGTPVPFSRRTCLRSLGDNTREIVRNYLKKQAGKSDYVDSRFKEWLEQFNLEFKNTDLKEPEHASHGLYWYNLHFVIVVFDRRFPMTLAESFARVRDNCIRIGKENACSLAEISIMPDHIHMGLRGNKEQAPEDIALNFLNGLSMAFGNNRCWSEECYLGTYSEYSLEKIR